MAVKTSLGLFLVGNEEPVFEQIFRFLKALLAVMGSPLLQNFVYFINLRPYCSFPMFVIYV